MCTGGRTVVQQQPAPQLNQKPKPVVYMRNQWLDGLGINAEQSGRASLRIDPGSPTPGASMRTGGALPPRGGGDSGLGIRGPGGVGIGIGMPGGVRNNPALQRWMW